MSYPSELNNDSVVKNYIDVYSKAKSSGDSSNANAQVWGLGNYLQNKGYDRNIASDILSNSNMSLGIPTVDKLTALLPDVNINNVNSKGLLIGAGIFLLLFMLFK